MIQYGGAEGGGARRGGAEGGGAEGGGAKGGGASRRATGSTKSRSREAVHVLHLGVCTCTEAGEQNGCQLKN